MEYNYGFLFKKSVLSKSHLNALLQFNDFVDEANKVMKKGNGIEDIDIYNIAKGIYFPMLKSFQTDGFKEQYKAKNGTSQYKEWSFRFRTFGSAVKSFSKTLFGDDERINIDYLEYCNQ